MLITGLPESGWSESDIIELVQPFGAPSDIILAASIGKVLTVMLYNCFLGRHLMNLNIFLSVINL